MADWQYNRAAGRLFSQYTLGDCARSVRRDPLPDPLLYSGAGSHPALRLYMAHFPAEYHHSTRTDYARQVRYHYLQLISTRDDPYSRRFWLECPWHESAFLCQQRRRLCHLCALERHSAADDYDQLRFQKLNPPTDHGIGPLHWGCVQRRTTD